MTNVKEGVFAQVFGPTNKKTGEYFFDGKPVVLVQFSEDEKKRQDELSVIEELNLEMVVFQAFLEQSKTTYWLACLGNEAEMEPFTDRRVALGYVKLLNRENS